MNKAEFSPWPSFTLEEVKAVESVLLSNKVNYWTGEHCLNFEKEFALWADTNYAVSLANGTLALDAALLACDIGPGDEVIVTCRTYIASVSSVINSGAKPVFSDVNLDSQNITAESILPNITHKTKAIICVHLAGWPCEMTDIMEVAKKFNLKVIEDCAQAHGALYKGKPVGSFGDIGCWSFCQDKIMSTGGEGGMITTNCKTLWEKIWAYKDHGKSYNSVFNKEHPEGFRWVHDSFGTNWRITEMQAAIGRIQLARMPDWHKKRKENACKIWSATSLISGLRTPTVPKNMSHAAYKCYVFIENSKLKKGWDRDRIMMKIKSFGVPCFSGCCPEVYLEKAFKNKPYRPQERLANAKVLGETSLMFLVHPTLTSNEIERTIQAIRVTMEESVK